jgi:hypothetical protein
MHTLYCTRRSKRPRSREHTLRTAHRRIPASVHSAPRTRTVHLGSRSPSRAIFVLRLRSLKMGLQVGIHKHFTLAPQLDQRAAFALKPCTWASGARCRARLAIVADQEEADCITPTCQTDERVAESLHSNQTHLDIRQSWRLSSLICCHDDLRIPTFSCGLQTSKGRQTFKIAQRSTHDPPGSNKVS